jgi:hypothetical protein
MAETTLNFIKNFFPQKFRDRVSKRAILYYIAEGILCTAVFGYGNVYTGIIYIRVSHLKLILPIGSTRGGKWSLVALS